MLVLFYGIAVYVDVKQNFGASRPVKNNRNLGVTFPFHYMADFLFT